MLKPNFKKMYLVSEEKIQALTTTNLSRGNLSNIDIQSYHNLKDGLNNNDQNQNKLLNSSQGQSNATTTNNTRQKGASLNYKRDEKEPPPHSNKNTTDQSTQTDTTTPVTPFRKIFTRRYKFRGRTSPIQENFKSKKKRKNCEMNLYHENNQLLPIKRKKQIKNISTRALDSNRCRKVIIRQKTNWLKLR